MRAFLALTILTTHGCADHDLETRVSALEHGLEKVFEAVLDKLPEPVGDAAGQWTGTQIPAACVADLEPVEATLAFVTRLESLMTGYPGRADRGSGDRHGEVECRTEVQASARHPRREQDQSSRGYLKAHTWADNLERYRTTRFGCHVHEPSAGGYRWSDTITSGAACEAHDSSLKSKSSKASATWRVKSAKQDYADGPSELMKRMGAAKTEMLDTMACWVTEVHKAGRIECQGRYGVNLEIEVGKAAIRGDAMFAEVNRGDVLAVKSFGEVRKGGAEEPWVIGELDADSVSFLQRSTCCEPLP